MGDIFSKWEILTLVEMKSVVQKRFLVFFFLVPHVERAAPQAYDCHTSSTFFGDWIQRTFFFIPASKANHLAWGWRGLKTMFQDLTQTGNINDGTSHRASKSSLAGGLPPLPARWPPPHGRTQCCPSPTCPDPHGPLKGGMVHFPHR